MMPASFFRRCPRLLLAVALIAQAVFFARDAQPARATHGSDAHLSGLTITGTVMRDGKEQTLLLLPKPLFHPHNGTYTLRVPSDLHSITFTPTWSDTAVTGWNLWELADNELDTEPVVAEFGEGSGVGVKTTKVKGVAFDLVLLTGDDSVDGMNYYFILERSLLAFDGATVADMTFTQDGEVPRRGLSQDEVLALALPKATGGFYNVTYTAAGLPEGLYMNYDRVIRGTPAAKTDAPATVTYTATDTIGSTAVLTFTVSVAPPVLFEPDQRQAFKDTIFEYTVGQREQINETLPPATGGHGALTYHLTYRVKEQRTVDGRQITGGVVKTINDDAPGFSFNAASRLLTSATDAQAPSQAAFYSVDYWAEDENGARAIASNSIAVNEAPTLRAIADQSFTVGQNVSITLPKAVGGTRVGISIRYRLEPAVPGLRFNGRQHIRSLTGRPTVPGTTVVAYTATDRNGVTATRTFTITVVNGASAPSSAPSSVQAAQTYSGRDPNGSGAAVVWDTVSGATGYVVQIRADGGSYPDLKVNSAPADVDLSLPYVDRGLAWINAISTGDYKVRVAARNGDGVGPWSAEVSFTVSPPTQRQQRQVVGQQEQQQSEPGQEQQQGGSEGDPCDTCGTGGEQGVVAAGAALSDDATLSGLALANAVTGSDAPAGPVYISGERAYTAVVLQEVNSVTVRPTAAAGDLATITVQLESGGTPQTVASGADSAPIAITPHADPDEPHNILVIVTAQNGDALTYTLKVYQYPPVSFGSITIPHLHFTQGAKVDHGPLPAASDDYEVTYTATGLPAGLSLSKGYNRSIIGTPTAATTSPLTVTYTATGEIGSTAALDFQVSVAPPVTFNAEQLAALNKTKFEYTIGQTGRINATLPEAAGGHGNLTYHLTYRVHDGAGWVEKSVNDDAPGFSFDPAARLLTSDAGAGAPAQAAYYNVDYWAEDENGARAIAPLHHRRAGGAFAAGDR